MEPSSLVSCMYSLDLQDPALMGVSNFAPTHPSKPPIEICGSIFPHIPSLYVSTELLIIFEFTSWITAADPEWLFAPTTGIDGFLFFLLCGLAKNFLQFCRFSACAPDIYVAPRSWTSGIHVLCRHSWMEAPAGWCPAPIVRPPHPAIGVDFTDFWLIYQFRDIHS